MRIALIHQYYLRPGQAGGSRFNEMARWWSEQGCEVWVVAGQVEYASGEKSSDYKGVRPWVREDDGPVKVLRAYTPDTYHRTFLGRALSLVGFGVSATTALAALPPCDVIVATSPPLTVAFAGVAARVLRGWPLVFEVRDLWPESAVATDVLSRDSVVTRALYRLEKLANGMASHTVALTPAIAASTIARGLQTPEHTSLIPNGADAAFLAAPFDKRDRDALRESLGWRDRFVVLYAGAHGVANHLEQLLDVAECLRDDPRIQLAAIGDGPKKVALVAASKRRGLRNLAWLDPVSHDQIHRYFDAADCAAAVLKKTPTFETVYPNKVFEGMARARPILCVVDGVARALVEEHGAGVFARPEDPGEIARVIRALAADPEEARKMGERGRELVLARFQRRELAMRYLDLLEQVVARNQ